MDQELEKQYPLDAKEYKLYEEVGEGVSATVYRALCIPLNEIVAVKVLDLEKCNNDLDGIRREVQTMTLTNHPNLLRAYCSFTTGHHLWIVMPYMSGGSCMHIMKFAYPEGFDEPVIATLLYEVLKALVYLHSHGHIHRDVKSGNILVDSKGAVKLADFGVSACMFDTGDRQRSRNTFVGTPCWMAPEVMQQLHGYDFKADIWSFGITALELAHGHAPFSKYPPMKVLLMTLQNAPPGLDYERDKRFSKSFKELVATCLVKDPKKRPSSEKLLKHHFFKRARATEYLGRTILDGLAPLGERFRTLKAKEAALLGQNKALYEDKEHLSQQEYIRGISAWNFNLEDLKRQAALIQDDDAMPNLENTDIYIEQKSKHEGNFPSERQSPQRAKLVAHSQEDAFDDLHDLESSLASFPIKPLQALKDCFDVKEDELHATSPKWRADLSDPEEPIPEESSVGGAVHGLEESTMQSSSNATSSETSRNEGDHLWARSSLASDVRFENKRLSSAPGHQDLVKLIGEKDRDGCLSKCQHEHNQRKDIDNSSYGVDTLEGAVIQRKGRFKVTSADSPKASATSSCSSPYAGPANFTALNQAVAPLLPSLQSILQQNAMQREEIVNLIKFVEQMTGKDMESADSITTELLKSSPVTAKERELQSLVINLQQSVASAFEELQRQRLRNAQLEKHIKTLANSKGE